MIVAFTRRALADLQQISDYYRPIDPRVAAAVGLRIEQVIARIAAAPQSARRVAQRPGVRVAPLIRYPYKIFYRVLPEQGVVQILHIRHSARRPLRGE